MRVERLIAASIGAFACAMTGLRVFSRIALAAPVQRIYFANHSSHGDFVLLWAALPPARRYCTRPVARADYWQSGWIRPYLANRVFRSLLINPMGRQLAERNPLEGLHNALAAGDSLIVFPEGGRQDESGVAPFKSGLYHLANTHPQVEIIPTWIDNLGRVLPKGTVIPLPLFCSVHFGEPLMIVPGENVAAFLERARASLKALAPAERGPC
jgi:1-acyl-sn-glycerol-3-phosphate acyltransferase